MKEFGLEEQERLRKCKVLVIGAGGLGSPILLYLTAAGIGTIGIVEFDEVDLSNLQRQILYTTEDIGTPKLDVAIHRLQMINPHTSLQPISGSINRTNARQIIGQYDIVIDGSDNFPTRYLVNDACVLEDKPLVHGSVLRFEGQVSVFNCEMADGTRSPNYRDLFPTPPPAGLVPNCAEAGVLGVLPGIIGSMQASEAIKIAAGIGESLAGRLWIFDALSFESRTLTFKKNPDILIEKLIDYDQFCGVAPVSTSRLTPKEVIQMVESNDNIQIIDVREEYEFQLDNINADLIPLSELLDSMDDIDSKKTVIIHCQSGKRSSQAIPLIKNEYPDINIYDLKGGINSWRADLGKKNLPENNIK